MNIINAHLHFATRVFLSSAFTGTLPGFPVRMQMQESNMVDFVYITEH